MDSAYQDPNMIEIRWHGRGGQGAWTASMLLAQAAIEYHGLYAQSFPEFGPERGGAPVRAYSRISDKPIRLHCGIYNPDIVVIIDSTLLKNNLCYGLKENGMLILNTHKKPKEFIERVNLADCEIYTLNATDLAIKLLKRPITNTAMLGALTKAINRHSEIPQISLKALEYSIQNRFGDRFSQKVIDVNIALLKKAYEQVELI